MTGDLFPRMVPCLKGRRQALADQLRISPMICWQLFPLSRATSMRGVSNHRGCHKRSGDQSRWDVTLRRTDKWHLGSSRNAAGWHVRHQRSEPAKMTKTLQWTLYQKQRGPDKIDRPETCVTPATLGLHQSQWASPSSTKGSEADRRHML
jgi:hypothetical protein